MKVATPTNEGNLFAQPFSLKIKFKDFIFVCVCVFFLNFTTRQI